MPIIVTFDSYRQIAVPVRGKEFTVICKKRSIFVNGLITLAAGLFCFWLFPHSKNCVQNPPLEIILDCLGYSMALIGQLIRISARGYKTQKDHQGITLVTGGPYSLTRNPMYLGSFLIGLGMFLILFPLWAIPIYCVFFLGWYAFQIQGEQCKLTLKLGAPYRDYCSKTPVFVPRFTDLLKHNLVDALPFHFRWVGREWPTCFAWLSVAFIHECIFISTAEPPIFLYVELTAFLLITTFALLIIRVGQSFQTSNFGKPI